MGEIIDIVTRKQEQEPIAQMFDDFMTCYADNEDFKRNVDQITQEICDTYGCGKGILHYIIKGFVLGMVGYSEYLAQG